VIAKDEGVDAIGYRQTQPGIEGEFYPSATYSSADYHDDFSAYTGTSPAIVGIIVASPGTPRSGTNILDADGNGDFAQRLYEASKALPEISPSPLDPPKGSLTADELQKAVISSKAQAPTGNSRSSYSPPAEEWAPSNTQIAAVEDYNGNAVVLMTSSWTGDTFTGSRTTAMPSDWGIEMEVSLFNDDLQGSHPGCPTNEVEEFWGIHDVNSWTVMVPGDTLGLKDYGAYIDWADASDPCSRNALAIGIGYPHNLPVTSGYDTIQTLIVTPRGTAETSTMSSYYQAVSNDCNNLSQDPHTSCMDLNTFRGFPGPGGKALLALNKSRGWTAPNCIFTQQETNSMAAQVTQQPNLVSNGCWSE
jgi:hypothetical protein